MSCGILQSNVNFVRTDQVSTKFTIMTYIDTAHSNSFEKNSYSINHTVRSWVILKPNLLIILAGRDQISTSFCLHRFSWSQTWSYLREDDQRITNIVAVISYLVVKQINRIHEEGSKYQLKLYFNQLSWSHTYSYYSRGRINSSTECNFHELSYRHTYYYCSWGRFRFSTKIVIVELPPRPMY